MKATLKQIKDNLEAGGKLVFRHRDCSHWLVSADGSESMPVDGRGYHAFVQHHQFDHSKFARTQTGSVETKDLEFTWAKNTRLMLTVYVENEKDAATVSGLLQAMKQTTVPGVDFDTTWEACDANL